MGEPTDAEANQPSESVEPPPSESVEPPPSDPTDAPSPSEPTEPPSSESTRLPLPDGDGDGVADEVDNCPKLANADQTDADGDGVGDACDGDADGVSDDVDNCPAVSNLDQVNTDRDGSGDACDPDDDGDEVEDEGDNCPAAANPDQADSGGDGLGDACEPPPDPDAQPPVLRLPAAIEVEATGTTGQVATFAVTAADDVDPNPRVFCDPHSGSEFPLGRTTVTCTAIDASGNVSSPGSFDVTVLPPPGVEVAPTAEDDYVETVEGAAVNIFFLTNDVDPDGTGGHPLRARITGGASNGSVELRGEQFVYTPEAGFAGSDRFAYTLCQEERCDSATAYVEVRRREGEAVTALTEPVWQAVAQRLTETIPGACQGALAWGGFANGRIPAGAMSPIDGGHRLERRASLAFLEMRAAAQRVGIDIPLTDSYRPFEVQVDLRRRKGGRVATATPGTSVHGWGKAIDINLRGPAPLRSWLEQNAVRFGWVNPAWARRPGKSYEPWHYEFLGSRPGSGSSGCAQSVLGLGAAAAVDEPDASAAGEAPIGSGEGATAPARAPGLFNPTAFFQNAREGILWGVGALWVITLAVASGLGVLRRRR